MGKGSRYYYICIMVVVNCFLVNILAPQAIFSQVSSAYDDLLTGVTPQVQDNLYSGQISDQSISQDLEQQIAPPPLVITTSRGDMFVVQGGSVKAQLSINEKGTMETTYSVGGAKHLMRNEFGEEFVYVYSADGKTVNVVNADGAVVGTSNFELGLLQSSSRQGTITYQYDDDGRLLSSTDDWGNMTLYSAGKPTHIVDADGETIGSYEYDGDVLVLFTDHTGSTTYFDDAGIRPDYTKNDEGTVTTVYEYDAEGHLLAIVNVTNGETTQVEQGYSIATFTINDETGEAVITGVFNYNVDGTVSSVTSVAMGVVTGWTEFDEYGRVSGSYNSEGSLVQQYEYNSKGFLDRTISLGAIDPLLGKQVITSYTLFDRKGRASEVWQIGEGDNVVKIQEFVYNEKGLLDVTYGLGVKRDESGNAIQTGGDFEYFRTSVTTYDKKLRPNQVLNLVYDDEGNAVMNEAGGQATELSQKYAYSAKGFLTATLSYGFGGVLQGRTDFDVYSRPEISYNAQGAVTQLYFYSAGEGRGHDGFLKETQNFGENGVNTGYTLFDAKGKPTEVFNHMGSIIQKYVYDQNGLLTMSLSLNGTTTDEVSRIVASLDDKNAIAALWDPSWDTTYSADFLEAYSSSSTEAVLLAKAWDALGNDDMEKAMAMSLKIIQLYGSEATAQQKDPDDNYQNNWALNAVGAAYIILAESCGDSASAVSAYKIAASDYSNAKVYDPAQDIAWSVEDAAKTALAEIQGVTNGMVTGYTVFGGDSRPIASYQIYDNGSGEQVSKSQDYVYSFEQTYRDADGNMQTRTAHSSFVQRTVNYGRNQVVTGYTTFDRLGRQAESFNEDHQLVQKYNYSRSGFLSTISSYGQNRALTGMTVFDNYSRPVAAFNAAGANTKIPAELIQALQSGITPDDLQNVSLQPYLKGLTQTFEYGADGFLSVSKSWGEAEAFLAKDIGLFMAAMGSAKGDSAYKTMFDFDNNGVIDEQDLALFDSKIPGIADFGAALGSQQGDATYDARFDYDQDGVIDKKDQAAYLRTIDATAFYTPTFTGETRYDKYGKAAEVTNAEGAVVQKYVYDDHGYLLRSDSFGAMTDENGNVNTYQDADGNTQPVMIRTGYTQFDDHSRPNATYSVYDNGTAGEQASLAQTYEYITGFLVRTTNYGDNEQVAGHTDFDRFGRQTASYNEEGKRTTQFVYSTQGFLSSTNNYGIGNTLVGRTFFSKQGRPVEAFNWTNDGTNKGLTQTFNYNQYGFLETSTSYGEDQTVTGTTVYNGYGKAVRVENDKGVAVSAYEYNERGFMTKTLSLAFVEDANAANAVTITNNEGQTQTGFFAVTGYTLFDGLSRPTESYQCYWDTPVDAAGNLQGALVQRYDYEDGFVVGTFNFGRNEADVGYTTFDKYGRQASSANEFDEMTTKFIYSGQGFLSSTTNYGADRAVVGKTTFNALGRPDAAYNQTGALVQTFSYNGFSGQLESSTSWGQPDENGSPTRTGVTQYDAFGKATKQFQVFMNEETGQENMSLVSLYQYDMQTGFMDRTLSLGDGEVLTGFTEYDDAGRPTSSYSVYNYSGDPYAISTSSAGVAKVQDFVYNTQATGRVSTDLDLIGQEQDTGFLRSTINYGDNQTVVGATQFNKFGQQVASFNEYDERTTAYQYSRQGFLSTTTNYGINNTVTGKTVFNNYGRPVAAYNERGALVQTFNYNNNGFLVSSTSYGAPDESGNATETGRTVYDAYGKQLRSYNPEGMIVSSYEYNERGFLTRSNNLGFMEAAGGSDSVELAGGGTVDGWYKVTGYTVYDAASRPVESYSCFGYDAESNEVLSQQFVYEKQVRNADGSFETVATGFITGTNNYTLNSDIINQETGLLTGDYGTTNATGGTTLSAIGTEVLYAGNTVYNKYGRPETSYNEHGALISRNMYSSLGFISSSINYGQDATIVGRLMYDNSGRPSYAVNHTGALTTEYHYSNLGMLAYTLGYQQGGTDADAASVVTSRTEFDVFSKATITYQLFEGQSYANAPGTGAGELVYTYAPGGTANYSDGGATGGMLSQQNYYNAFGSILKTESFGRPTDEGQKLVSTVYYDSFSRPTEVYNDSGGLVQTYTYNNGFLEYTTVMSEYDGSGQWETVETKRTFFNKLGQQTATYIITDDGQVGAKEATFEYNRSGFLSRSVSWADNTRTGYTVYDASGRQITGYNAENTPTNWYYYTQDGFLRLILSTAIDS